MGDVIPFPMDDMERIAMESLAEADCLFRLVADRQKAKPPLPPPIGAKPHVTSSRGISGATREALRRRMLYALNVSFAREFGADPTALRDTLEELLATNFAPCRHDGPMAHERDEEAGFIARVCQACGAELGRREIAASP